MNATRRDVGKNAACSASREPPAPQTSSFHKCLASLEYEILTRCSLQSSRLSSTSDSQFSLYGQSLEHLLTQLKNAISEICVLLSCFFLLFSSPPTLHRLYICLFRPQLCDHFIGRPIFLPRYLYSRVCVDSISSFIRSTCTFHFCSLSLIPSFLLNILSLSRISWFLNC